MIPGLYILKMAFCPYFYPLQVNNGLCKGFHSSCVVSSHTICIVHSLALLLNSLKRSFIQKRDFHHAFNLRYQVIREADVLLSSKPHNAISFSVICKKCFFGVVI